MTPQIMPDWFTRLVELSSVLSREQLEERLVRFAERKPYAPTARAIRNWRCRPSHRITRKCAAFVLEFCRTALPSEVLTGKEFNELREFLETRIGPTCVKQEMEIIRTTIDPFSEHAATMISKDGLFQRRLAAYQGFYALYRIDGRKKLHQELIYIGGPGDETLLINYGGYIFHGCTFVASSVASAFLIAIHLSQTFCFRFFILNTGGDARQDIHPGLLMRIEDNDGRAESSEIIARWMDPEKYPDLVTLLNKCRNRDRVNPEKHVLAAKYVGPREKDDPGYEFATFFKLKPPYISKMPNDILAKWDRFKQNKCPDFRTRSASESSLI